MAGNTCLCKLELVITLDQNSWIAGLMAAEKRELAAWLASRALYGAWGGFRVQGCKP